ncbi:cytochrome c peroxidase [Sulfurimonas gotlandica GD1]|jgi:cytochrome c peroxidase|uniref:Cytochrome c peroxidase n=1 Tax=Sulfurimonas gotlandica (strain DSM 19862 / JCM 16533 / GD1) TaxID=929558 RepID=B6BHF0_SULGG|nr:cytochrome c peroxidase [Sulfurimonas gotlandica]EDZ63138.1 cytochrome c551 peroxidase [Sulfurimonas gotlandica GD1]EHP29946.1 cytochrome c peroxidase [Sulfurimonas gotlandica GD1]
MKFFVYVFIFIILLLTTVSFLLPTKEKRQFSDESLRTAALSRNMSSTPATYEDLLKLVDTPKNRLSKEKIDLGRDLYHEKMLSKDKDISCATCHVLSKDLKDKNIYLKALTSKTNDKTDCVVCHLSDQSGTDRFETAVGHGGAENPFHLNTLTTLNAALAKFQTWDGHIKTIEEQVGLSIQDPTQMNLSKEEVERRLLSDAQYVKKFALSFDKVSFENTQKAIAAYLKTLVTRSGYDRFLDGDNDAMNQKAKKGLAHFLNFGCKGCHTGVTVGGQSIQKFPLRDYNSIVDVTNSFNETAKGREVSDFDFNLKMYHPFPFENKGGFMGKEGERLFRVPMLRNVTKTSPYFHNGAIAKLREAVFLMGKHQLGMHLTDDQIDEIVEFLKALEGDVVDYKVTNKGAL